MPASPAYNNRNCFSTLLHSTLQAGPGLLCSWSKWGQTPAGSDPEDMQLGWNGAESKVKHRHPFPYHSWLTWTQNRTHLQFRLGLCPPGAPAKPPEAILCRLPATSLALCSTPMTPTWKCYGKLIDSRTQLQSPRGNKRKTFCWLRSQFWYTFVMWLSKH